MPNAIKYSTSAQTLALKDGNFWIATGDVSKGTTVNTDYWNGITPPVAGYTIYLNKDSQGPSIYVATSDDNLIFLTNRISGTNYSTVPDCLSWFLTQTDKMVLNRDYEPIVTNGLVLNLDAGFINSYPRTGTTWNDITSNGYNGTLTNGPLYSSDGGGSIVFDGVNDNVLLGNVLNMGTNNLTINSWIKISSSPNTDMYIFSKSFYGGQNYRYGLTIFNSGNGSKLTTFMQGNGGGDVVTAGTTTLSPNVWYMITTVFNRSSNIVMYVNGVVEALSGTPTISQWNGLDFQSINPARIGSYTFTDNISPNLMFKGNIAQTQIYNRSLSSTEVLQNYNATKSRFGL